MGHIPWGGPGFPPFFSCLTLISGRVIHGLRRRNPVLSHTLNHIFEAAVSPMSRGAGTHFGRVGQERHRGGGRSLFICYSGI